MVRQNRVFAYDLWPDTREREVCLPIATPLRVLVVEDSDDDAALLTRELRRGGFVPNVDRVQDEPGLRNALDHGPFDIVIADYALPGFSGLAALRLVREREPDLPFVVVSGTIGDDVAVEAIKAGASDYVLKDRLTRLVPTVERELRASADRRAHRRLEDQLRHSQKMEAVGRLAGGIAHDFNNLLTAILGYTELALDSVDDPEKVAADLEEIRRSGQRAASLTRQLLAFSRRSVVTPEVVDLITLIRELTPMLRRLIGEDIRLEAPDSGPPHRVFINPGQMEQVIVNLVVNARDAMPSGGTLTIRTSLVTRQEAALRQPGDRTPPMYVRTSVLDTGEGMTQDTLDRLFEPFFTTKDVDKGTGLGLSTVFGIVRQHGGHISVSSAPAAGARFDIDLPLAGDEARAPAEAAPRHGPPPGGTETILLVEDEDGVRQFVRRVLERVGYAVLEGRNVEEAMEKCRSHSGAIDLVLSDIVLPQMSGPQLVAELSSQRPEMKVLFMSGYADREHDAHPHWPVPATILEKPFGADRLVARVREALLD